VTNAPRRLDLGPTEVRQALQVLNSWTPADRPPGPIHSGDLGWELRHGKLTTHLWLDGQTPVAVGFLDSQVMRLSLSPGADGSSLTEDVDNLVGAAEAWCDGLDALETVGWTRSDEPWVRMVIPANAVELNGPSPDLDAGDVADRVAVQRAGFERSTFTVERWQTMRQSPAGEGCFEVLVRTPAGEAASAATGWLAGPGRCAVVEPMATHPDHRGHGYGKQTLERLCAGLVQRGASAVAVTTPAANTAAVALYRSAGFTVVGEQRDLYRPARQP
jgi:ribosomal protein S18 acetylase RimI-like enzyme